MRKLVLWGHTPEEYQEMFDLTKEEMNSSILEFGCGPSAVNVLQSKAGHKIVSCDPLFTLDKDTLYSKTALIFADMVEQVMLAKDHFDFSHEGSLEKLIAKRRQGMEEFFADYKKGKKEKRYIGVTEYTLPYDNHAFDFALSSHYLFAELDNQDVDFHIQVICELARVAKEVRVFPLIDRTGQTSSMLGPVLLALQKENYGAEVRQVPYHLQATGNAMLRVWAQECKLENK
ncbi:hypothetical protein FOG18_11260 [Legionella israelensis]|uniref:hypothetical protein n=1 Tax=Legionella israelensis TaxID=454 RepID=UPI00117D5654|nr:hypothetical protein [Legionella israelensis]QDP73101.1 hypothetical protein FOG18_11260 [Legionella israelensis]